MHDDRLQRLVDGGHRLTAARRATWQALVESRGHVTAEQLAERVDAIDPGINLASVYRSLGLFAQLGLARESRVAGEDASRWEVAHPDEHFHLVCEVCGRIDHHVGTLVEEVRRHLSGGHGFEVHGVELMVTGRCHDCQQTA